MSLLPQKVTLMSISTSNTYMILQNFQKPGKNAKLSKKRTLPISAQNLFLQWCPLIRDYTVKIVAFFIATLIAVVIIAFNYLLLVISYYQYEFTMVAMIIVAAEANNDGNNIYWLFIVVLQGVCCFIFVCFLGNIDVEERGGRGGLVFIKLQATVFPAVSR